jgi:hypothetical protein
MAKKTINKRFPKGIVPNVNLGFNGRPVEDLVEAKVECLGVYEKETGVWVPMVFKGKDKNYPKMYGAGDLLGLEHTPCVKDGDSYRVDDTMLVTWTAEMETPEFHASK